MSPHRLLAALVFAALWLASLPALAHGLHPGVLTLTEQEPGVFTLAWTEPVDTSGAATPLELVFPEQCQLGPLAATDVQAVLPRAPQGGPREPTRLDCAPTGLHGTITLRGLTPGRVQVLALVQFLDGRTLETMLDAEAPELHVDQAPGRSPVAWLRLGVEHVLGGLDHLAFVLGLLLVVGTQSLRRLAATITAFTIAHSLTLALAATGTLVLPSAPVEATIAASVVLVAREATHDHPTLTRRAPWAVALAFGLVHGLGFAGALASWGLPVGWVGWSLLWFNLGIELGQLAVVLVVVVLGRAAMPLARRSNRSLAPLHTATAYAIGGLGAWWLLERTLAILTGAS